MRTCCILQACTYMYITIWCATMHDNKTHVAYDCITHQMTALWPTMHHFVRTRLYMYIKVLDLLQSIASKCIYRLQCLSNYSGCVSTLSLVLRLMWSTAVLLEDLSEDACMGTQQPICCQAKKTTKTKGKLSVKLTTCGDGPVKCTGTRQGWNHKKTTLLQNIML